VAHSFRVGNSCRDVLKRVWPIVGSVCGGRSPRKARRRLISRWTNVPHKLFTTYCLGRPHPQLTIEFNFDREPFEGSLVLWVRQETHRGRTSPWIRQRSSCDLPPNAS